jgi:FAD/FMN-containing dehydrogenase
VAKSDSERRLIWDIRDEVEPVIGGAHNFDVSLKSADVGRYVRAADSAVRERFPDASVIGFGHLGDNNVHVSVAGIDWDEAAIRGVEEAIYGCLRPFAGAISAEHGIGLEKRTWLPVSRTAAEIELMRSLKRMLDPKDILNPGKVVGVAGNE